MDKEKTVLTKKDIANLISKACGVLLIGGFAAAVMTAAAAAYFIYVISAGRGSFWIYVLAAAVAAFFAYCLLKLLVWPLMCIIKMKRLSFFVEEDHLSGYEEVQTKARNAQYKYYYDFHKSGSYDSTKNFIIKSLFITSEPGDMHCVVKLRPGKHCPLAAFTSTEYTYSEKE